MGDDVINFTKKRHEAIEKKRREFERVVFRDFLGVRSVVQKKSLLIPVQLLDIAEKGCLFELLEEGDDGEENWILEEGEEFCLRIYFTHKSFLPISSTIKYRQEKEKSDGEFSVRYGCAFDRSPASFEAIEYFIKFIYKFAEFSLRDK